MNCVEDMDREVERMGTYAQEHGFTLRPSAPPPGNGNACDRRAECQRRLQELLDEYDAAFDFDALAKLAQESSEEAQRMARTLGEPREIEGYDLEFRCGGTIPLTLGGE